MMYLFKYVVLLYSHSVPEFISDQSMTVFPPFWIFGAFVLIFPSREPLTNTAYSVPVWIPEKIDERA